MSLAPFDFTLRPRLVFGPGSLNQIGELAGQLDFHRTLLVADNGLLKAGHVARAGALLEAAGIIVTPFHDFDENPDTNMVEKGRIVAAAAKIDSIIGLGGGSSLDCAKAINFVHSCGGAMRDYWGHNKATRPLLPMIGVPCTTGTGSEAQTYALISDAETHVKMACGDDKAAFRIALLDPELAISQPAGVRATAGYDAISHAVESFVTTKRNAMSDAFSRQAWRMLSRAFPKLINQPEDIEAVAQMQLGSWFAGCAIEASMLGATHATANPLTARYGTTHGSAIAIMLPHVVQWNGLREYDELSPNLPALLADLAAMACLPGSLEEANIPLLDLSQLAEAAAQQWTGRFNPRPFDAAGALELYQCAY